MVWEELATASRLKGYVARWGASHLLAADRPGDALERLQDLVFLAALATGDHLPIAVKTCGAVGASSIEQALQDEVVRQTNAKPSSRGLADLRSVRHLAWACKWKTTHLRVSEATLTVAERLGQRCAVDRTALANALKNHARHEEAVELIEANLEAIAGDGRALARELKNLSAVHIYLATKTAYTKPISDLLERLRKLDGKFTGAARMRLRIQILETAAGLAFVRAIAGRSDDVRKRRLAEGKPVDDPVEPNIFFVEAAGHLETLLSLLDDFPDASPRSHAMALKNLAAARKEFDHPDTSASYLDASKAFSRLYGHGHPMVVETMIFALKTGASIDDRAIRHAALEAVRSEVAKDKDRAALAKLLLPPLIDQERYTEGLICAAILRRVGLVAMTSTVPVNNLAWKLLEAGRNKESAPLFAALIAAWTSDPLAPWAADWAQFGESLCRGDRARAEAAIERLAAELGDDHERVARARERVEESIPSADE